MNATFKIQEGPFSPTVDSLKNYICPDWFRDAKFGIWSHWGPQSVPMYGDWYARHMYTEGHAQYYYHWRKYGHPSKFGYKDIIKLWKAEKFDPAGKFIRRYVPELAGVSDEHIHAPWQMGRVEQEAVGVVIGRDYPAPIIDHAQAREQTLARYAVVRKTL